MAIGAIEVAFGTFSWERKHMQSSFSDTMTRAWMERRLAPFAEQLGWRPVFEVARVMVSDELELKERRALRPGGLFTMLHFEKRLDAAPLDEAASGRARTLIAAE